MAMAITRIGDFSIYTYLTIYYNRHTQQPILIKIAF